MTGKVLVAVLALAAGMSNGCDAAGTAGTEWASRDDRAGVVMGQRSDVELMVGPADGARAFVRRATRKQIEACTREPLLLYPDCLP